LIITEVRIFRQVKNWLLFVDFIVFIVENFNQTLSNEIHFFNVTSITNNSLAWSIDSAIHTDDKLIGKSSFALFEEMVEGLFEFFEDSGVLNQVSLHLWGDLLIELELFNNQVEIIEESLFDVLSDIVVQSWLNMEWLV
jgi:hypothetical protein